MAKPRIFISSTHYDLKHIRASLDLFIDSLGYESILSEKGEIAYNPDIPLDESCYREVQNVDIFVLIIGGKYGSASSSEEKAVTRTFYDRYESITKKEYESSLSLNIPSYILIESNVNAEYQTYLRNKGNDSIKYAHVDSINIFRFIEEILSRPRNNPVLSFEKFAQIEDWLRLQWAGLFRDLLKRKSQQSQLKSLTDEVAQLQEVNKTLKTYLEALMTGVTRDESSKIIESEENRLKDAEVRKRISENEFYKLIIESFFTLSVDDFIKIQLKSNSYEELLNNLRQYSKHKNSIQFVKQDLIHSNEARASFNESRYFLGLPYFKEEEFILKEEKNGPE